MRLVHQTVLREERKLYYYFRVHTIDTDGLDIWRDISDAEFSHLKAQLPRIQRMSDSVLGQDTAEVQAQVLLGENSLFLKVPYDSEDVRSLIGWIELFGLEETPQPAVTAVPLVTAAFPLGNPGFAD